MFWLFQNGKKISATVKFVAEFALSQAFSLIGLKISNIRYWGSQPWTFPATSLMVAFTAKYESGDIVVQPTEILEAGFFNSKTIPGLPSSKYSLAGRLINDYVEHSL